MPGLLDLRLVPGAAMPRAGLSLPVLSLCYAKETPQGVATAARLLDVLFFSRGHCAGLGPSSNGA
jgi:hypothetical protein